MYEYNLAMHEYQLTMHEYQLAMQSLVPNEDSASIEQHSGLLGAFWMMISSILTIHYNDPPGSNIIMFDNMK